MEGITKQTSNPAKLESFLRWEAAVQLNSRKRTLKKSLQLRCKKIIKKKKNRMKHYQYLLKALYKKAAKDLNRDESRNSEAYQCFVFTKVDAFQCYLWIGEANSGSDEKSSVKGFFPQVVFFL